MAILYISYFLFSVTIPLWSAHNLVAEMNGIGHQIVTESVTKLEVQPKFDGRKRTMKNNRRYQVDLMYSSMQARMTWFSGGYSRPLCSRDHSRKEGITKYEPACKGAETRRTLNEEMPGDAEPWLE